MCMREPLSSRGWQLLSILSYSVFYFLSHFSFSAIMAVWSLLYNQLTCRGAGRLLRERERERIVAGWQGARLTKVNWTNDKGCDVLGLLSKKRSKFPSRLLLEKNDGNTDTLQVNEMAKNGICKTGARRGRQPLQTKQKHPSDSPQKMHFYAIQLLSSIY